MKCPNCQFENRDNAKFCKSCGYKLASATPQPAAVPDKVDGVTPTSMDGALRVGWKTAKNATVTDALIIGAGQAIATCPGISRSGMTICMGCFRGFDRRFAVRFAFLLSIPAVLGANILQIKDVVEAGGIDVKLIPGYLLGVAAAAVSGYLSIRLVRMVADKGKFGAFAYYCWAAGAITVILSVLRALNMLPWLNPAA